MTPSDKKILLPILTTFLRGLNHFYQRFYYSAATAQKDYTSLFFQILLILTLYSIYFRSFLILKFNERSFCELKTQISSFDYVMKSCFTTLRRCKKNKQKNKKTSQKEKKQVLTKWFSTKFKKKNQGK